MDIELEQKGAEQHHKSSGHRHHRSHRSHHRDRKDLDDALLPRPRPVHRSKEEAVKLWKTPKEVALSIALSAQKKVTWAIDKFFVLAFMAGLYVGLGAAVSFTIGAVFAPTSPGWAKFLLAATFPMALLLILILGGELWTGDTMYFSAALFQRNVSIWSSLFAWVATFFFNWAGCVWYAWFFGVVGEQYTPGAISYVNAIAEHKVALDWGVALVKGIPANFLVCAAIFVNIAAEDIASKIIGIYACIATFVLSGYEHVVANMYTLSLGYFLGADYSYGALIYRNLIPVAIGNFIGGGIFVGVLNIYFYSFGEDPVAFETAFPPVGFDYTKWSFIEWWRRRSTKDSSTP